MILIPDACVGSVLRALCGTCKGCTRPPELSPCHPLHLLIWTTMGTPMETPSIVTINNHIHTLSISLSHPDPPVHTPVRTKSRLSPGLLLAFQVSQPSTEACRPLKSQSAWFPHPHPHQATVSFLLWFSWNEHHDSLPGMLLIKVGMILRNQTALCSQIFFGSYIFSTLMPYCLKNANRVSSAKNTLRSN